MQDTQTPELVATQSREQFALYALRLIARIKAVHEASSSAVCSISASQALIFQDLCNP